MADLNALHSRKHDHEVQLYAFDILTLDGDDLCELPLSLRMLARRPDGIFVAPFEQGEIGPNLFRAGVMGLEGLVRSGATGPIWLSSGVGQATQLTRLLLFLGFFFGQ